MKHGKVPTKRQKMAIKDAGLSPDKWFYVSSDTKLGLIEIVHRETGKARKIPA